MSYKNLEIWKFAREQSIEIHAMTMSLPKFEFFEERQQIRKSSKTIKFLIYALSSNDETIDHLETLYETHSLTDQILYETLQ